MSLFLSSIVIQVEMFLTFSRISLFELFSCLLEVARAVNPLITQFMRKIIYLCVKTSIPKNIWRLLGHRGNKIRIDKNGGVHDSRDTEHCHIILRFVVEEESVRMGSCCTVGFS